MQFLIHAHDAGFRSKPPVPPVTAGPSSFTLRGKEARLTT